MIVRARGRDRQEELCLTLLGVREVLTALRCLAGRAPGGKNWARTRPESKIPKSGENSPHFKKKDATVADLPSSIPLKPAQPKRML